MICPVSLSPNETEGSSILARKPPRERSKTGNSTADQDDRIVCGQTEGAPPFVHHVAVSPIVSGLRVSGSMHCPQPRSRLLRCAHLVASPNYATRRSFSATLDADGCEVWVPCGLIEGVDPEGCPSEITGSEG